MPIGFNYASILTRRNYRMSQPAITTSMPTGVNSSPPPVEILSVEDNPADAKLLGELLRYSRIPNRLNIITDGACAIDYLLKLSPFERATRPDLVLLDLKLPKVDGREVLKTIRTTVELSQIPVVIFTGSDKVEDIEDSYSLQANAYIVKPFDLDSLTLAVKGIEDLWLKLQLDADEPSSLSLYQGLR
jgi:two-component system, chemotaxis family, response regulator Rcp1